MHATPPNLPRLFFLFAVSQAYYLYNAANDRDYGQESIEILLNVMESQRDALIVVLAGYKDRMDKFFSYIPGMNSRVGNHIEFPNYEKEHCLGGLPYSRTRTLPVRATGCAGAGIYREGNGPRSRV